MSSFKFHPYFALICIKSDIHSSLKEQLHSLEYLPALFGVPRYLKDASNNITCGALEVLRYLLPRCPLSTDLLASLKQPFNDEVISMDPSSSRRARNLIHKYLMVSGTSLVDYDLMSQHLQHHGTDYRRGLFEETNNPEEDESLPHFDMFLIQDKKHYNLSYELWNGWELDDSDKNCS